MQDPPVTLACRNVWKVFGDGAGRVLEAHGGRPRPRPCTRPA